jgi:hypothetical protein
MRRWLRTLHHMIVVLVQQLKLYLGLHLLRTSSEIDEQEFLAESEKIPCPRLAIFATTLKPDPQCQFHGLHAICRTFGLTAYAVTEFVYTEHTRVSSMVGFGSPG